MGVLTPPTGETSTLSDATFACADLMTFCRLDGLLRPTRQVQRPHRGDQWPHSALTRLRPRVPQPHQLHRQITARDRRPQTTTTPSLAKSRHGPQHAERRWWRRRWRRGGECYIRIIPLKRIITLSPRQ